MKTIQWLAAVAAVSLSLPVFATPTTYTTTYDFVATSPTAAPGVYNPYTTSGYGTIQNDYGNKLVFAASSGATAANSTVSVTAYASTGATSGKNATSGTTFGSDTNAQIDTGIVTYYSGNGLAITSANGTTNAYGTNSEFAAGSSGTCNPSGKGTGTGCVDTVPEHAIDNEGAYEALLLSFNSKVKLTALEIGFPTGSSPDSDATVLYYTGSGVPPVLTNYSFASLLATGGWAIANGSTSATTTALGACAASTDSLYNIGSTSNNVACIASPVAAQYFLIGAYIPLTGETNNTDPTGKNPDYIKLKSISTTVVPEPSTLALFGIAGGALIIRRRRSARAV